MPRGIPNNKNIGTSSTKPAVKEKLTAENVGEENETTAGSKDNLVTVVSKTRANKKIIAKTGEVIKFDKDGVAHVSIIDAMYLKLCPGFETKK